MSTNDILDDALNIIRQDVGKIRQLSEAPEPLNKVEASKIVDYTKVLVLISKKDREDEKNEGLEAKSDEELAELAKEAAKYFKKEDK